LNTVRRAVTLLSTVDDIRSEMETVLRLDEGYQNGSAHMVLGLVYLKAPGLLGGDSHKAVEEMEKGLHFGEGNAFLRLHLAEAYQAVGRKADARKQLEAILSMTPDPDYLPEYKEAAAEARRMLDSLKARMSDRAATCQRVALGRRVVLTELKARQPGSRSHPPKAFTDESPLRPRP